MKIISILLLVVGVVGLGLGSMMFGDIGVAASVGGVAALLSGVGFSLVSKTLSKK